MKKNWMMLSIVLLIFLGSYTAQADVYYEYYEGTWDVLPDFNALTPIQTGVETGFNLDNRDQDEYIGFRFTGYIEIATTGDYTFYTNSDDGSALYIGNSLVVNNDGLHSTAETSGSINLSAGKHAITVTYFNKTGAYVLEVRYEGPGISKTLIPGGILSLTSPTASYPVPAHEARGVSPAAILQWQPPESDPGATYNIYFDTDPNFPSGPVETNYSGTTYDPLGIVDMTEGTTYYWRIDGYDPPTTGNRWSFTVRSGLVAYYQFEGDPNDSSGNGHHGVFRNGAKIVVDQHRGNVLSLDGTDDYMDLVNPQTASELGIGGNNPKSMAAWVYTRSFNNGGIFDVGAHSNGQEFSLRTMDTDNLWRVQYYGGDYDVDFQWDSLDTWVHFALVHDGAYTRMYANGILVKEAPRVLNTSGSDTFRIGQYSSTCFDGLIDDFSLWDYALSQEQVRRLMPAGDYNADSIVDVVDLKTLTDDYLTDNTTPVVAPDMLEDFELYSPTGFPPITLGWITYDIDPVGGGSYTLSLLIDPNTPPQGDKAMGFAYHYPVHSDSSRWLTIGHRLGRVVDLAEYDELRIWVNCHGHEDVDWYFHMGGVDDPVNMTGEHEVATIGPFSTTQDLNVWREVVIDLRNDSRIDWASPYSGIDDVHNMHAILLSTLTDTTEAREGSIDFDGIRLLDYTPGCSENPAADLNGDCVIDLNDYAILAANFLKESGP